MRTFQPIPLDKVVPHILYLLDIVSLELSGRVFVEPLFSHCHAGESLTISLSIDARDALEICNQRNIFKHIYQFHAGVRKMEFDGVKYFMCAVPSH